MRGEFSNYGTLGITQISEAIELAKVYLHKMRKIKMDIEFMEERDFNQISEDGYDANMQRLEKFNDVLACFESLRTDVDESYEIEIGDLRFNVKQLYNSDGYDCTQIYCGDDEEQVIRNLPELLEWCVKVARIGIDNVAINELRLTLGKMFIKWDLNEVDEV